MKKKSKAVLVEEQRQQELHQVELRAALRWSDAADIAPDVLPPPAGTGSQELTTGWVFNLHYRSIEVACSSSVYHAIGRIDRTQSQGARLLYSTPERALRALRVALEREFAETLLKIDKQLENTL